MEALPLIKKNLQELIKKTYSVELSLEDILVERPTNESWGDHATNVSLMLAKQVKQSSTDVAKKLSYGMSDLNLEFEVDGSRYPIFSKIDFEDPGFVNFTLSGEYLLYKGVSDAQKYQDMVPGSTTGLYRGQKVLLEYTDPNPFKVFHIGHLMSNAIGEALSRLTQFQGAEVKRANYQGDVGMHIAKSVWGVLKKFDQENKSMADLEEMLLPDRMNFLGKSYADGATAFLEDKDAQVEIGQINAQVYQAAQEMLVENEGWKPVIDYSFLIKGDPKYKYEDIKEIYTKGREWSLEDFEVLYDKLGTKFDYYFFESKAGEYGLKLVKDNIKEGVFEEDQGAVIFRGEPYGLHTRVFVNSLGLPAYEAKDMSLPFLKHELFKYDKSYIITANEINDYFKVVLKAMEQTNPELSKKTIHIGHGVMKFKTGKMSSRTGDVITGKTMLEDAKDAVLGQMAISDTGLTEDEQKVVAEKLGVGAVKYTILKHNTAKDIIYDKEGAISITGNTGPYLQYTHARASSVIEKAGNWEEDGFITLGLSEIESTPLEEKELVLLKHLTHFEQVAAFAAEELSPSVMCEYLFELAQRFNAFYNDLSILNAENETRKVMRLYMTKQVRVVLKVGLWLLGIEAPVKV